MSRSRMIWIALGVLLVVGIVLHYSVGIRPPIKPHVSVAAEPVFCLGGERKNLEACASGFPVTNSLLLTIIVDIALVLMALAATRSMQLVPRGFQNLVESVVETFYNFARGVDRKNVAKFFPFCCAAFLFILFSNLFGLVPGVGSIGVCAAEGAPHAAIVLEAQAPKALLAEEDDAVRTVPETWAGSCAAGTTLVPFLRAPSADLNVTIAWGLVSVALIQLFGFQALGPGYLKKFFNGELFGILGILELISEFVRIIAFAFRLFGNIFAGEVILVVMATLLAYVLPAPFYAFELFVAFMQAIIFAVLSLIFMSLAVVGHGHDDQGHSTPVEAADH